MVDIDNIESRILNSRNLLLLTLFAFFLFGSTVRVCAQSAEGTETKPSPLDTIPEEARAVFERYVQKKDTVQVAFMQKYKRDKFIKRISFHTNAVDWVTLVPNIGIEVDLKQSPRTNYSIALFGKFNGNSTHEKFVYNVNAIRVEGRKYWRTGKYGSGDKYHDNMVKLVTDTTSVYYNADRYAGVRYYNDGIGEEAKALGITNKDVGYSIRANSEWTSEQKDSLDFAEDSLGTKNSRFRAWFYNTYHKVRRNYISGRTLDNPRNWRAYYLGLWAGVDNWSLSLTGKGKQGNGMGLGVVAGYTLPLLPQKYPHEGSLDLDLGLAVGWKAVKYDAYRYEEHTQHYVHDAVASQSSWKIVPYPIIQDIHVSLVWRFRGIKHKVDRSLIDDYAKQVDEYVGRETKAGTKSTNIKTQRNRILEEINRRSNFKSDSTSFWDIFHKRRLEAAVRIKPDTVFTGKDHQEYLRLIKGISIDKQEKYLKEQKKLQEKAADAHADSLKRANKEAERLAKIAAKESKTRKRKKDTVSVAMDSLIMVTDSLGNDLDSVSVRPVVEPILPAATDTTELQHAGTEDTVPQTESMPKEETVSESHTDNEQSPAEENGNSQEDVSLVATVVDRRQILSRAYMHAYI